WWDDICGLTVESRLEQLLVHPDVVAIVLGIGVLAVLPIGSPTAIRPIRDVDDPLALAFVIAVVIDADQIAVFVERELLQVADAAGKYFEVGSVRIGSHHGALIGI